jgi:MFS family permease
MGFSIAAAEASSVAMLIIFRLISGIGGSLCIAVGGGTVTDLWDMRSNGRCLGHSSSRLKSLGVFASLLYVLMPFLEPTLGK